MVCLKDKIVVVTGASSGIGKAVAELFARKGAKVVLAARRVEKLKIIRDDIKKFNKNCIYVKTDVTIEKEVKKLISETEKEFGRIDILVNNAGVGLKSGFLKIDYDWWRSVIDTNLNSVFLCSKEVSKSMIKKKVKGHIITVSSLAAKINIPGYSGYCCSKHAVTSFMNTIKWELIKNRIKVSTIHPYKVNTEFFNYYKKQPGRSQMLSPYDLGDFVVALATRNPVKIIGVVILNFFKRIYYAIRYAF